jgi:hypothetical protein
VEEQTEEEKEQTEEEEEEEEEEETIVNTDYCLRTPKCAKKANENNLSTSFLVTGFVSEVPEHIPNSQWEADALSQRH